MSPLASAKAISSCVAMRAGRSWLRWTGPAASGPESRITDVVCGVDFGHSNESNRIESNRLVCGTESIRIESFSFLPNRPSLLFSYLSQEIL